MKIFVILLTIPDNECSKLKDLVLLLQQHKHSSYCKRGGTCRFNFPHPPSTKTLIAYPHTDDDDFIDLNTVSNALSKVRKELIDGNVDVSIEQLLNNAKVSVGHYEKALTTCSRGNAIVLKLTNYNPKCYVSMASKYGYTICAECLCLVYDEK